MAIVKHTVSQNESGRIDLIVQKLTGRSRTQIRGLFDHNCVMLNDEMCTNSGTRVNPSDVITLDYDLHRNYKEKPKAYQSAMFEIVYEDEYLLVVDKKAGFLTEPNHSNEQNTVLTGLVRYLSLGKPKRKHVAVVHRLDRDTSGLLVFAKSEDISQKIKAQFERRKPKREYQAIVAGRLENQTGTFRSHLATDKDLNQYSTQKTADGKLAITHYKVEKTYKDATLVTVTLETGRRNQIRVHFAEQRHPVLGDIRYEAYLAKHPRWKWKRLALHAALLGFTHPATKKELLFRSKTPDEFGIFDQKMNEMNGSKSSRR